MLHLTDMAKPFVLFVAPIIAPAVAGMKPASTSQAQSELVLGFDAFSTSRWAQSSQRSSPHARSPRPNSLLKGSTKPGEKDSNEFPVYDSDYSLIPNFRYDKRQQTAEPTPARDELGEEATTGDEEAFFGGPADPPFRQHATIKCRVLWWAVFEPANRIIQQGHNV
ncbi:MAG: hypothetical protein LQ338_002877 [Usnochroma carphineum]|nr:MAG: hypothetical protein LQ338_002877 [Usnochroma carphineum]